jgi:hypothetical protein
MFELQLGDLQIIGENSAPPAKLIKALGVVSAYLHPGWDAWIAKGKSKQSCVLCAVTVHDFLRIIGFPARVVPVLFLAVAKRNGTLVQSVGMGWPDGGKAPPDKWNGHLVTLAGHWLVDTTLYQAQRSTWPQLPGMIAVSMRDTNPRYNPQPVLASICTNGAHLSFDAGWMLDRNNRYWKYSSDSRNKMLREPVIWELVERFSGWDE